MFDRLSTIAARIVNPAFVRKVEEGNDPWLFLDEETLDEHFPFHSAFEDDLPSEDELGWTDEEIRDILR